MLNSPPDPRTDDAALDRVMASGPRGAASLAGVATALVLVIFFAFYFLVFVPRAVP